MLVPNNMIWEVLVLLGLVQMNIFLDVAVVEGLPYLMLLGHQNYKGSKRP